VTVDLLNWFTNDGSLVSYKYHTFFVTGVTVIFVFSRLKTIDDCVEKFLEEFNDQVQKLTADEFKKIVSCISSDIISKHHTSTLCLKKRHCSHTLSLRRISTVFDNFWQ